tara:strand:- start:594 stop:1565 length:972 start_codon:yes stop_codon:yes gene_type:complete
MTTYIKEYGQNIELLSSDPSNPTLGQIWYNTTSKTLKGFRASAGGTWTTANAMAVGKSSGAAAGTQSATLQFGGRTAGGTPLFFGEAQKYNGTSWTTDANSMITPRGALGGCGTQTAAVAFGGFSYPPFVLHSATETYNGTSWATSPASLPATVYNGGSFGTQTAAVSCGSGTSQVTNNWNGSAWTASGNMIVGRNEMGNAGTQTAGLIFSGNPNDVPIRQATEKYNGTSWTSSGNFGSGRYAMGSSGTQTAALAFGGGFPTSGLTEQFNGSTWSAKNNMGTAFYQLRGAGNITNTVAFGGTTGGASQTAAEEWNPEETIAIF